MSEMGFLESKLTMMPSLQDRSVIVHNIDIPYTCVDNSVKMDMDLFWKDGIIVNLLSWRTLSIRLLSHFLSALLNFMGSILAVMITVGLLFGIKTSLLSR